MNQQNVPILGIPHGPRFDEPELPKHLHPLFPGADASCSRITRRKGMLAVRDHVHDSGIAVAGKEIKIDASGIQIATYLLLREKCEHQWKGSRSTKPTLLAFPGPCNIVRPEFAFDALAAIFRRTLSYK